MTKDLQRADKSLDDFAKPISRSGIQDGTSPIIGALLFLLAIAFYFGAVLRIPLERTGWLDLDPYPDAVEYFAQASAMAHGERPAIQIGYYKLPSRYPPGYPVLMLPWIKALPDHPILAPFRTNETIGLLLLLGGFLFYFSIGRPLAGGLAALVLATMPCFVTFSRSSISELSGAALSVTAFALAYLGLRRRRRWYLYVCAIILGLSLCIRAQLIFLAPLLIAMALFPDAGSRGRWFCHCVLALFVFALAASPYFILNTIEFGSPLKTGYDFWVPWLTDKQLPFSLQNLPRHSAMLWSEMTGTWEQFRVAHLFGSGSYLVPSYVLLSLIGLGFVRFGKFELGASLAGITFLFATMTYNFVDGRFYMPIFFLLIAVAILPVEWAIRRICHRPYSFAALTLLALFVLTCIGFPSKSGYKPQPWHSQAWDALHYQPNALVSRYYVAQKSFIRQFHATPGIVLSEIDPAYLNALWPPGFVAAPLDGTHHYNLSRIWHYGKAEALQLIRRGLASRLPVYVLLAPSGNVNTLINRLPTVSNYHWHKTGNDSPAYVLLLTPDNPRGSATQ
jgi:hypothetical protein